MERRWLKVAGGLFAGVVAFFFLRALWLLRLTRPGIALALLAAVVLLALAAVFRSLVRRRHEAEAPFPDDWRRFLEERVTWYRRLPAAERPRFEESLQCFLADTRITGVETDVDDEVRLLVAASAMIPVFGYPGWRYADLEEVLIYPRAFSDDYGLEGPEADLLGLTGSDELSRVIILSKPDLREGFRRSGTGVSPGIHEFIHRFDGADGALDGVPALGEPDPDGWLDLVDREIGRLERGRSALDPYAATDEVEFLAVAAETFFLHPERLRLDHPELYQRLTRTFRQDPLAAQRRETPRRQASPHTFRPRRRPRRK